MKKLLIIMIFVPISENYCTNGEFFLKLKNFGALQYEVRIETIAGEFYFDESYHPVKPINTLIFQNSDNDIVKADLIFDHNNNGTKDINGNEFLIYYGKYKIIVKFSNQEYWMIIDYQDCQISSAGGDVIDVYFYFTYVENKFIKTNSGFSYNSEDFTSKTFNFTMNQLGKEIIEYCFKIDLKLKNILEDNLNSSFGSIFIDGVEYFSDTTVSLKHNNYYLFYDEKNLPNSLNMFRDWKIVETQTNIKYPNPANLKFIENAQLFGEYYPTYPLTVTNYLEGVNGGSYSVTWQAANKTYTLNSGEVYFAFDNNKTRDKYHINVAQTIQSQYGTDWQFQNWDDGSTNATITNLAVKVPTTRTAYYKGNLRSDDAAAFANSGQRKVITTPNGNMYLTYESMNSVWLEKSTDNGATWQLMNNGKPINSGIVSGKSPSLSLDYDNANNNYYSAENNFYLVYQEYIVDTEIDNILQILYFKDGINTPEFSNEIPQTNYTGNINLEPVIAKTFSDAKSLLLVYKLSSSASSNPGLYYLLGKHNPHTETNITWYGTASTYIANTSNNSNNPSIAVNSAYFLIRRECG